MLTSSNAWQHHHHFSGITHLAIATPNTQPPTMDQNPIQPASTYQSREMCDHRGLFTACDAEHHLWWCSL